MLVNPHQVNKNDTIPSYIPSQAKAKLTVGEFFLRLKNVSQPAQMQMFQQTTTFTLTKHGERRTIYHLYCADFTEQGVPSSMDTFIGLIDAAACLKRHIQNEIKTSEYSDNNKDSKRTPPSAIVSKSNSNTSKDSRVNKLMKYKQINFIFSLVILLVVSELNLQKVVAGPERNFVLIKTVFQRKQHLLIFLISRIKLMRIYNNIMKGFL